ncbi:PREDICTED: GATA zinc finger domain-containing protein 1 [Bactrocera latifrons]|uniref:GATA zinc finger domain-containing protein 1 n=1 Tax=Bactrocera latifrons TaxID=174628 RepID=UPI0008DC90EA|nr:PREDICTED: GATA zinc finger domain-containing protein 1 [Bactrocera latifrons]
MSNRSVPICIECQKTETLLWRQSENGEGEICQECYEKKETKNSNDYVSLVEFDNISEETKSKSHRILGEGKHVAAAEEKKIRKSTRSTRFKAKSCTQTNNVPSNSCYVQNTSNYTKVHSKGRSRRNIFKKIPLKTPVAQATTHVVESVFYKGTYLQVGDIVSLMDDKRNIYYAQIRGLLVDTYCEKSAYLTWLVPTQASPDPRDGFDPASYLIGPDEDLSRKLSALQFIMHAPSNYYYDRTTPFPLPDAMEIDGKTKGFIWTTLSEYHRTINL